MHIIWPTALTLTTWITTGCASKQQSSYVPSPEEFSSNCFDFLIVGGGTSGLVVASRLSENPSVRVGILETGRYLPNDININTPMGSGYLGNPVYDWNFKSVPQAALGNRQIPYPRGKIVGGSSAINSMIWQRASRQEYDLWASAFQNGRSWTFDALLPYFKNVEKWTPPGLIFPNQHFVQRLQTVHGSTGPVHVSYPTYMTDVDVPSILAANNLGIFTNSNPDAGNATGFPLVARSVDPVKGIRSYAANAYYGPNANRSNLVLLTGAHVTRLNFKKKNFKLTAIGVDFKVGNRTYSVLTKKEVILAAGSLQTPQLLEVSGIGNKTLLSSMGIPFLVDIPEVGENLQDHPVTLSDFKTKATTLTLDKLRRNSTFSAQQQALYNKSHTGALTYTTDVLGPTPLQSFISRSDFSSLLAQLDASLSKMTTTALQRAQYAVHRQLLVEGKVGWVEFVLKPIGGLASAAEMNSSYVTAVAINLHPFGRGSVHINSSDPTMPPLIDPKFLQIPFDANVLLHGTKFVRKWMQTEPMSNFIASSNSPPESVQTDAEFNHYIRKILQTTNHPLGTTPMAPRSLGGVVNPRLKVHHIENVRIVDAGVIPMSLGVAILSTVYAIAEKAADMIKEDHGI